MALLISGMDKVITYINEQDQIIKNLRTNETVREEFIVEMKSEMKSLHKKLDLAHGSNNPLNLKDKGFGFHGSGSPRSKPYHELLSEWFKKNEKENEDMKKQYKSMVSKCGGQATNKVKLQKKLVEKDEEIKKLKEQVEFHKEMKKELILLRGGEEEEVDEEEEIEEQFANTTFIIK